MILYQLKGPIGIMVTITEALVSVDILQQDTGIFTEIIEIVNHATVRDFSNNGYEK